VKVGLRSDGGRVVLQAVQDGRHRPDRERRANVGCEGSPIRQRASKRPHQTARASRSLAHRRGQYRSNRTPSSSNAAPAAIMPSRPGGGHLRAVAYPRPARVAALGPNAPPRTPIRPRPVMRHRTPWKNPSVWPQAVIQPCPSCAAPNRSSDAGSRYRGSDLDVIERSCSAWSTSCIAGSLCWRDSSLARITRMRARFRFRSSGFSGP